jgi:hypothetical protein
MIPYRYDESRRDCGPRCLLSALSVLDPSITWERLMAAWGRFGGDRHDSPWHHDAALRQLGALRREVSVDEIVNGLAPADRTVVLVHDVSGPLKALLNQHWVLLRGRRADGKVVLDWGDSGDEEGPIKYLSPGEMIAAYRAGAPCWAYCVGEGSIPHLSRARRLWVWLTQLF